MIEPMDTKQHRESAGGVIIKDGQVLLIYSAIRNSYSFPKGTIDEGETIERTAIREVKEETGYNVKIMNFLAAKNFEFTKEDGEHYSKTVSYYLMQLADNEEPEPNLQPGEDFINIWTPVEKAFDVLTFDDSKDILTLALERLNKN